MRRPRELVLVGLFVLSGSSGLIDQVVWVRMMIRAFGITIHAVSTVVAVFLGGLALGSFLASRLLRDRPVRLLRWYALAELVIGGSALFSTWAAGRLPTAWAAVLHAIGPEASPALAGLIRFLLATAVLIVPTTIMGATLPLITAYVATHRDRAARQVGLFYGANTFGAAIGTLGSGFVLLAAFGEIRTAIVAAAVNVAVGLGALFLARGPDPERTSEAASAEATGTGSGLASVVIAAYAASGFCALGYEIVWSRLLNLVLGNSVYAFSAMLAVYLSGIALGSVAMARALRRFSRTLLVFGLLEVAVAILVLLSIHAFVAIGRTTSDPQYTFSQLWQASDFLRLFWSALAIVLPVTLVLGAIFPVAMEALRGSGQPAELVGRLYAFNTLGSIAGSLLTGFVAIPLLGTLDTMLIFALGSLVIGCFLIAREPELDRSRARKLILGSGLVFVAIAAVSFEDPFLSVLRARVPARDQLIAHREDRAATVSLFQTPEGSRDLYINGLYVSSTSFAGHFMMHSSLLLHPSPRRAMMVGMGVGDAFSAAIDHGVEATVVDLASTVVELFPLTQPERASYLKNERARIVINDGRNHLLGTDQRYDVVLVDDTPPIFASGMVNLYSREFLELVRDHLTPEGLFVLWVPLYCFDDDIWMIARNFAETFAHLQLWLRPGVSGVLLFGSAAEITRDPALLTERLEARGIRSRQPSYDPAELVAGMRYDEATIRRHALTYPLVTDDRPRTEFPLSRFLRGKQLEATSDFVRAALDE